MKEGATYKIEIHLNTEKEFDDVIFTLKSKKKTLSKTVDTAVDGVFTIALTQEDTIGMGGNVQIEAQINYSDKSVAKSQVKMIYINESIATSVIDGNYPSDNEGIDVVLDVIKGDVAILITPESSRELIEAVTELFNQTKAEADEVYLAYKSGELKGEKGDKGDKGDTGSYLEGNGIDIGDETISVKLKDGTHLSFDNNGNVKNDANRVYPAVIDAETLELIRDKNRYPNIKQNDIIVDNWHGKILRMWIVGIVTESTTLVPVSELNENFEKLNISTPPSEIQEASSSFKVENIVATSNFAFYRCTNVTRTGSLSVNYVYHYTWEQLSYSKEEIDTILVNLGDVEFNHREMVDVEVSHDSNYTLQLNYASSLTGTFTGAIPYKDIVDEKVYIDYDSISMVGSQAYYKLGNQSDGSDSVYYGGITYTNEQGRNGGYFLIPDSSLTFDYKYLFISLITPNDSYPPQFTNGRIKYTVKQEGYAPRTLNDDYYIKSEVDELLLPLATKEEMKKENEWETIGSVNKGMSGTSTLLDFNDIPIPANNDYRAWRILYYVNPSSSGTVEIYFNGQSQSKFWFGGSSTVSGKKFVEIIIESDLWNNIDGTNRNMYGTATLNRCNVYNYGQRTNFLATCGNYIDIANITSIKLNIGASWTFGNTGGCTVILQGRR